MGRGGGGGGRQNPRIFVTGKPIIGGAMTPYHPQQIRSGKRATNMAYIIRAGMHA